MTKKTPEPHKKGYQHAPPPVAAPQPHPQPAAKPPVTKK